MLIARALYRRPSILLLDEATSYLDVGREVEVNAAIRQSRVTRVIVAHRPQTIRSADRIIALGEGRVVKDERNRPAALHKDTTQPATLHQTKNKPAILYEAKDQRAAEHQTDKSGSNRYSMIVAAMDKRRAQKLANNDLNRGD